MPLQHPSGSVSGIWTPDGPKTTHDPACPRTIHPGSKGKETE